MPSARIAILTVVLVSTPVFAWAWLHNGLVTSEERVVSGWSQVESNYQRRADLIPQLVESVAAYARHERATLKAVAGGRGEALSRLERLAANLDAARGDCAQVMARHGAAAPADASASAAVGAAQGRLEGEMHHLLGLVENYPALKAGDQFLALQAQLEGTENRINVARMRFNGAVEDYNRRLRTFPSRVVAQAEGFQRRAYFQAEQKSADAGGRVP